MTVLKRLPMSVRVHAVLEAAMAPKMPVGLLTIPRWRDEAKTSPVWVKYPPPFLIVYPLGTVLTGPPLGADRDADATWTYQVSSFAERGDQLEWMRDKVFEVFLGKTSTGDWLHPFTVPGMKVINRELADDSGLGDPSDEALSSDLRFTLTVTPVPV